MMDLDCYDKSHFLPSNPDAKRVYHKEELLAIRDLPASRKKPNNILKSVLANDSERRGYLMNLSVTNYSDEASSQEDVKLHESENPWRPACFNKDETVIDDDKKKTENLYKTFRGVLNKLTPQKYEILLSHIKSQHIDTEERLQGVVDLVFKKAVNVPDFSGTYALMCKELGLMRVPTSNSTEYNLEFVNFRKFLIGRCQVEFEKQSVGESVRNEKVREIEECTDLEKKKDLQFDLEEYNRCLRMTTIGNVKFIGELFKQNMLTVNIMLRCLNNLLENRDEESLECLCKLLTTVGKELESKSNVNLSQIFNAMKNIVDRKDGRISSRIRFMLQDVIDLKNSKWVPRRQDLNPKTIEQIQKEADNIQLMDALFVATRRNEHVSTSSSSKRADGRGHNISFDDGWIINTNKNRTQFIDQIDKLKSKAPQFDEPLYSRQLFGNWGKSSVSANVKAPLPTFKANMSINTPLDIEAAYNSRGLSLDGSYNSGSPKSGLQYSFNDSSESSAHHSTPVPVTSPAVAHPLAHINEYFLDMSPYLAKVLVDLICEQVLPLGRLHKSLDVLINQGHAAKLLAPIFKLVMREKGPNFLQGIWLASGLQLTDFIPSSQVNSFVKDNQFEILVGGGAPVGHTQQSYEQIQEKLLEFLRAKIPLYDIVNWIKVNVGDRVKEKQFIKALATVIFRDSISPCLKLVAERLSAHNILLLIYVSKNPTYELQCLFALQALIHKLEHPQGLLLSICDKLYELGTFSQESFIAWENSTDPAEQEGKRVALKQLTCFFTQLKENDEDEYGSSTSDEA